MRQFLLNHKLKSMRKSGTYSRLLRKYRSSFESAAQKRKTQMTDIPKVTEARQQSEMVVLEAESAYQMIANSNFCRESDGDYLETEGNNKYFILNRQ